MDKGLTAFAWEKQLSTAPLKTLDGRTVKVINPGCNDSRYDIFTEARVEIGYVEKTGSVVIGADAPLDGDTILVINGPPLQALSHPSGEELPQAAPKIPEKLRERFEALQKGAPNCKCGAIIGRMEPFERAGLYASLATERLIGKYDELTDYHIAGGKDWNNTLYIMAFRAMAGNRNRRAYISLAKSIPFKVVLRERDSLESIEALLVGGAGLLNDPQDDYSRRLHDLFGHLRIKHGLVSMSPEIWNDGGYPHGSTRLRLAQLASFFVRKEFLFDNIISCRSAADVYRIFDPEASEYWSVHYKSGEPSSPISTRMGRNKAAVMGINCLVPLIFAYGKVTGNEELRECALRLLEEIWRESNSIVNAWSGRGAVMRNALDTQAILQLNNVYCKEKRCAECRIGRREMLNCVST
jgi:hypothetical protein